MRKPRNHQNALAALGLVAVILVSGCQTHFHPSRATDYQTLVESLDEEDYHSVRQYLATGGNPNVASAGGHTLLHVAVDMGDLELGKILIDGGIDMDRPDNEGNTALHDCLRYRKEDYCRLLLDSGAGRTSYYVPPTALDAAVEIGYHSLVEKLLKEHPELTLRREPQSYDVLQTAAWNDDLNTVKMLLASRMSPREFDSYGWLPIHAAANAGNADMVSVLIKAGSPANLPGGHDRRYTPLYLAVSSKSMETLVVLLTEGRLTPEDINVRSAEGFTPLHEAALHWPEAIPVLLKAGGDPYRGSNRIPNSCGVSTVMTEGDFSALPIHWAVALAKLESISVLLDADPEMIGARSFYGEGLLHWAVRYGNFCQRPDPDRIETLGMLLDRGGSIDMSDDFGNTPLLAAVKQAIKAQSDSSGHRVHGDLKKTARFLYDAGADPNKKNKKGETPLVLAQKAGLDESLFGVRTTGKEDGTENAPEKKYDPEMPKKLQELDELW